MNLAMGLEKWPLLLVNNEQLDADWGHYSQLPDKWQGPENEVNTCRKGSRNEEINRTLLSLWTQLCLEIPSSKSQYHFLGKLLDLSF